MVVNYTNNNGGGFASNVTVAEDTTVREFFKDQFGSDANAGNYVILVNGAHVKGSTVLAEGDDVTITPTGVKGA